MAIARHVRRSRPGGRRSLLLVGEAGLLPLLKRDPHILGLLDTVGISLPILPVAIPESLANLLHRVIVVDDFPRPREASGLLAVAIPLEEASRGVQTSEMFDDAFRHGPLLGRRVSFAVVLVVVGGNQRSVSLVPGVFVHVHSTAAEDIVIVDHYRSARRQGHRLIIAVASIRVAHGRFGNG